MALVLKHQSESPWQRHLWAELIQVTFPCSERGTQISWPEKFQAKIGELPQNHSHVTGHLTWNHHDLVAI